MSFDVAGKYVLVTGGGRGIGAMIAEAFAKAGAHVIIASRSEKQLAAAAEQLSKNAPGSVSYIAADLSKYEAVEDLVAKVEAKFPALDVLVNNSGSNWGASLEDYPDSGFAKVITLNLQRVFTLTQKLAPLLRKAAEGPEGGPFTKTASVVNLGSIDGLRVPGLETYAYSASKAGLHHLSRSLAVHLAPHGVRVNTIAAGPFETKMMAATLEAGRDVIVAGVPLGRIGTPADIGAAAVFLSSPAANWITGVTLPVDGGMVLKPAL